MESHRHAEIPLRVLRSEQEAYLFYAKSHRNERKATRRSQRQQEINKTFPKMSTSRGRFSIHQIAFYFCTEAVFLHKLIEMFAVRTAGSQINAETISNTFITHTLPYSRPTARRAEYEFVRSESISCHARNLPPPLVPAFLVALFIPDNANAKGCER